MKRTCAMYVRHDLDHVEFGLGAVANHEDGLPAVQKWFQDDGAEAFRIDLVETGLETATDEEDHADAVLLRRLPDIHGQGHSQFAPVDNIAYALLLRSASAPASTLSARTVRAAVRIRNMTRISSVPPNVL